MKYISNNFANPVLYEISIINEIFNNSPSSSAILVVSPKSEAGTECPYQISQRAKFKFLLPPNQWKPVRYNSYFYQFLCVKPTAPLPNLIEYHH